MAGILEWLNESPLPHAEHNQRCTLRYGRIKNDKHHVIAFINYCQSPIDPLILQLPEASTLKKAEKLGSDGCWQSVDFELLEDNHVVIQASFKPHCVTL